MTDKQLTLQKLLDAPLAYDCHVPILAIRRQRKRKGTKARTVVTTVLTSKQQAEIGAEALMKVFSLIL